MIKNIIEKGSQIADSVDNAKYIETTKNNLKQIFEDIANSKKYKEDLRIKATNEIANISNNIGKAQGIMKFIEDNENELDENTKDKLWKEYINILDKKSDLLIK
jgi:hypothetical protein